MKICKFNKFVPEAMYFLKPVLNGLDEYYKQEIENGKSELYFIENNTWLITRIEYEPKTLVVSCIRGKNIIEISEYIYKAAKLINCVRIEFHTKRKGLVKMLKKWNFKFISHIDNLMVYSMNINYER
jgi:hypothetical protein